MGAGETRGRDRGSGLKARPEQGGVMVQSRSVQAEIPTALVESDANRLRCSVPSRLLFARPRSERRQPPPRLARRVEQGAPDEDGSAQRDVPSNHRDRAGLVGEPGDQPEAFTGNVIRIHGALRSVLERGRRAMRVYTAELWRPPDR